MKATLEIPIRTVSEANQRCHWSVRAKRAKRQRNAVALFCRTRVDWRRLVVEWSLFRDSRATVELTRVSPRVLDDDNLRGALKATRDQIADELGLKSDRDPRVCWVYAQQRGKPKEHAVTVEVELVTMAADAEATR